MAPWNGPNKNENSQKSVSDPEDSLELTVRLILTLAELVRVVVGVVCLRSQFGGQFKDGDGHLAWLEVQQTRLVRHAAQIVRQE